MKVYTKVVIDMASGETVEEQSFDYDGPVAECKGGGIQTTTVTSPQAERALSAVMPALERIGEKGSTGSPLYDIPAAPVNQAMGYFNTAMPSAANIGAIDPNIKAAVAQPYEEALGNIFEKFAGEGVMGSATGGLSGAGAKVLKSASQDLIPQYTQSLWNMVQPSLLAQAQTGASLTGQEWGADIAARQAPYGPITQIAGGTMPTTLGNTSKK